MNLMSWHCGHESHSNRIDIDGTLSDNCNLISKNQRLSFLLTVETSSGRIKMTIKEKNHATNTERVVTML